MLTESHTAIIARGEDWVNGSTTEPYEAAWAREATIAIRRLEPGAMSGPAKARVQISLDGMHWADEGTVIDIPVAVDDLSLGRLSGFPSYLRLEVDMARGDSAFMLATLFLRG